MMNLRLVWESVRHTNIEQLVHRLRLTIKRKYSQHFIRGDALVEDSVPPLRKVLPSPLFPARKELITRKDGAIYLRYLNRYDLLHIPMQWHPSELEFGTRLEKLNLHYMEYLEALNDDEFMAVVSDWISQNIPYRPGYWLDNWNSYALSIRVVVWLQQLQLRQDRLNMEFQDLLVRSVVSQIRFLLRNLEVDICGNHIIKNIKALLWAGRAFEGEEAKRWIDRASLLLERELNKQLLSDGLHFELSGAYHAQVFADLLECYSVFPVGNLREHLANKLWSMAQVLTDLTHPDGKICLFNDSGLHMTYQPNQILSVYTQLFELRPNQRPMFALSDGGYFGCRNEFSYFLADCGRIAPDTLPAHGHGDILSFEWDVFGKRIVVDTGVYEYHPGIWRDRSRSTRSHNTVTLDDNDQCEFWKAFRVGRRANVKVNTVALDEGQLILDGEHDGFHHLAGRPVHRRHFEMSAQCLAIDDEIRNGSGQAVHSRLLLHPDCQINVAALP